MALSDFEDYAEEGAVASCAATNLAARNIGNKRTLYSLFGLGILDKPVAFYVERANKNPTLKSRYLKLKVLCVSEIMLIPGDHWKK